MAGYERPYARWLPVAWRINRVPQALVLAVVLAGVAAIEGWTGDGSDVLSLLALLTGLAALGWTAWVTATASAVIREQTADWEPERTELPTVRERRPHGAEADRLVAHDEYAVAVADAEFVLWRFRPLRAAEEPGSDELLIRGVPRYAASIAGVRPLDADDTARAAEQLVAAQEEAAALETAAAERARGGVAAAAEAAALAAETASTVRALRGITGQDAR